MIRVECQGLDPAFVGGCLYKYTDFHASYFNEYMEIREFEETTFTDLGTWNTQLLHSRPVIMPCNGLSIVGEFYKNENLTKPLNVPYPHNFLNIEYDLYRIQR